MKGLQWSDVLRASERSKVNDVERVESNSAFALERRETTGLSPRVNGRISISGKQKTRIV